MPHALFLIYYYRTFTEYMTAYDLEKCFSFVRQLKLECGPMPNVMAAQPNIGDAICESSV